MAGFFKKLFGGGEGGSVAHEAEPYEGCMIAPAPQNAGGSWRVAGTITKELDGETYERSFVRADTFTGQDEAVKFTLVKGRQIIDQNGKSLFSDGVKSRPA
uniref:HlyU family transcriptional regulator n=1 Tax=Pararhizobium sp. IMCC3301 TaxID=3067904 RepID=UPI002740F4B7|nr:HlyU family transcriptional regulator [Pararhizobium sp. IMCC3301]